MKATPAEIAVANRLLHFNGVDARLELQQNGKVVATGVLATVVDDVASFMELSRLLPAYFMPFHIPAKISSPPPKQGQQTLF